MKLSKSLTAYQGYSDPQIPASDYFKVKTERGDQYLLKHDLEKDGWYLCK